MNSVLKNVKEPKKIRSKAKPGDQRLLRGKLMSKLMIKDGLTFSEATKKATEIKAQYGYYKL